MNTHAEWWKRKHIIHLAVLSRLLCVILMQMQLLTISSRTLSDLLFSPIQENFFRLVHFCLLLLYTKSNVLLFFQRVRFTLIWNVTDFQGIEWLWSETWHNALTPSGSAVHSQVWSLGLLQYTDICQISCNFY